jgi:hypothetical protein
MHFQGAQCLLIITVTAGKWQWKHIYLPKLGDFLHPMRPAVLSFLWLYAKICFTHSEYCCRRYIYTSNDIFDGMKLTTTMGKPAGDR